MTAPCSSPPSVAFFAVETDLRSVGCVLGEDLLDDAHGLVGIRKIIRQFLAEQTQVAYAAAHETFYRNDGIPGIVHRVLFGRGADLDTAVEVTDHRGQQVIAVFVR